MANTIIRLLVFIFGVFLVTQGALQCPRHTHVAEFNVTNDLSFPFTGLSSTHHDRSSGQLLNCTVEIKASPGWRVRALVHWGHCDGSAYNCSVHFQYYAGQEQPQTQCCEPNTGFMLMTNKTAPNLQVRLQFNPDFEPPVSVTFTAVPDTEASANSTVPPQAWATLTGSQASTPQTTALRTSANGPWVLRRRVTNALTTDTTLTHTTCASTPVILWYSTGYIQSINYPNSYPNNMNCTWWITTSSTFRIRVDVIAMDLEWNPDCSYDSVKLYDGTSYDSLRPLAKMCYSSSRGQVWYSRSSSMTVLFTSDTATAGSGFKLKYQAVLASSVDLPTTLAPASQARAACDSTSRLSLRATAYSYGFIQSINYPNTYPNNMMCTWWITASSSYRIRVDVVAMDLETNSDCSYDSVKLYDGTSYYSSRLLAKMCSNSSREQVWYSRYTFMRVVFTSDTDTAGSGFKLKYQAVLASSVPTTLAPASQARAACDSPPLSLRATSYSYGFIQSINYPNTYPNNMNCTWWITASSSYRIRVDVIHMDLERSTSCTNDYVKLYDGTSYYSRTPLAKMCNTTSKWKRWYSRGTVMSVVFTSDGSVARTGFKLHYQAVPASSVPTTSAPGSQCQARTDPPSTMAWNFLQSPNFPNTYPNSLNCQWRLTASHDNYIHVHVVRMSLEFRRNCNYDSLALYDGYTSNTGRQMAKMCSSEWEGHEFYTTGQFLYVTFSTDSNGAFEGFQLKYQAVDRVPPSYETPCPSRAALSASTSDQVLVSSNYPGNYPDNQHCSWVLTAPVGYVVRVYISDLDLEGSSPCAYDSLRIDDGEWGSSLGNWAKMCDSQENGRIFYSNGRSLLLQFTSDSSVNGRGFKLLYRAVPTAAAGYTRWDSDTSGHSDDDDYSISSPSYGVILGGVVGSVAFVILVVVFLQFLVTQRKRQATPARSPGSALLTRNGVYVVPGNASLPPAYDNAAYLHVTTPPAYTELFPAGYISVSALPTTQDAAAAADEAKGSGEVPTGTQPTARIP